MLPKEQYRLERGATREFFFVLGALFLVLVLVAAALIYSGSYVPSAAARKLWAILDGLLASDVILLFIVLLVPVFLRRDTKTAREFERPGVPGGRTAAYWWIAATLLACGACACVFFAVTAVFPEFATLFESYAFILMSLCVAFAQQFSVATQIARSASFWQRTFLFGMLSLGTLYSMLYLYNERSQVLLPGTAEFAAVVAAVLFTPLLGWQQAGQLVVDRTRRMTWSVATGLGATLATYGTFRLLILIEPHVLEMTARPGSFLSRNEGWLRSTLMESLIWTGIACAQAVVIYRSPPVRDVEERF